jgi:tRNA 2-thiouridine synthesizing protein A
MSTDVVWDAGDLACGDLLLQLRLRMEPMPAGQVLRLVALDPGAPADLPAWCRLTGHTLLSSEPPVYRIRRKEL